MSGGWVRKLRITDMIETWKTITIVKRGETVNCIMWALSFVIVGMFALEAIFGYWVWYVAGSIVCLGGAYWAVWTTYHVIKIQLDIERRAGY